MLSPLYQLLLIGCWENEDDFSKLGAYFVLMITTPRLASSIQLVRNTPPLPFTVHSVHDWPTHRQEKTPLSHPTTSNSSSMSMSTSMSMRNMAPPTAFEHKTMPTSRSIDRSIYPPTPTAVSASATHWSMYFLLPSITRSIDQSITFHLTFCLSHSTLTANSSCVPSNRVIPPEALSKNSCRS